MSWRHTYDGLCIEGPLAGQMLSHPAEIFYVPRRPSLVPFEPQQESGTYSVYTYRWQEWHTPSGVIGVWSAPETEVLRVLLETYAAARMPGAAGEGGR